MRPRTLLAPPMPVRHQSALCAVALTSRVTGFAGSRYLVLYLVRRRRQCGCRRNKQGMTQGGTMASSPKTALKPHAPASRPNPAHGPATQADKVARKGETHAPPRSVLLPRLVADKIQFVKSENLNLRKELSEIKVLQLAAQACKSRESTANSATPPAVRGAKRHAATEQNDNGTPTMSRITAHMTALLE
ncbi:hypothetical protein MRX96_004036 [Rhipicephalus microplus]